MVDRFIILRIRASNGASQYVVVPAFKEQTKDGTRARSRRTPRRHPAVHQTAGCT
jgi:hypothetical protein